MQPLRTHYAIVRGQVHEHAGYEVKAHGDGFMIAFAGARQPIPCARAIQRAIYARLREHPDGRSACANLQNYLAAARF